MIRSLLLPCVAALTLTACENSGVAYSVDGDKNHSISLLREQRWFWSGEVEQAIVAARMPVCQRRVAIDPGSKAFAEMKLYQNDTLLFVAEQNNQWWAVGTEACQVQKFKSAPTDPGDLLGSFQQKDGKLVFVPVPAR